MYLGKKFLKRLSLFITGFEVCLYEVCSNNEWYLRGFHEFVSQNVFEYHEEELILL